MIVASGALPGVDRISKEFVRQNDIRHELLNIHNVDNRPQLLEAVQKIAPSQLELDDPSSFFYRSRRCEQHATTKDESERFGSLAANGSNLNCSIDHQRRRWSTHCAVSRPFVS